MKKLKKKNLSILIMKIKMIKIKNNNRMNYKKKK